MLWPLLISVTDCPRVLLISGDLTSSLQRLDALYNFVTVVLE